MSAHQSCCCQCHFPCSKPQPLPASKEDPPVLADRSFPVSYEVTAFFPESWCRLDLVGALQEWSFCFSGPVEFLQSNPAGLQIQNLWGLLLLLPGPKSAKPDIEIKTFTLMGELLWYQYFPVYESPTQKVQNFILSWSPLSYCLIVASLSWIQEIFFVDGRSAVSCRFGVFVRKGELPSYSAILLASPNFLCFGKQNRLIIHLHLSPQSLQKAYLSPNADYFDSLDP